MYRFLPCGEFVKDVEDDTLRSVPKNFTTKNSVKSYYPENYLVEKLAVGQL